MNRPFIRTISGLAMVAVVIVLIANGNSSAQTGPIKGNLHVVSIGAHNAKGQQHIECFKRGAEAHSKIWVSQKSGLYNNVFDHQPKVGEQATKAQTLADLDKVCEEAKPYDTAAIYIAAHGGVENNQFGMALYDGVLWESEIRERLLRLAAKGVRVILILESCHSGAISIQGPNIIVFAACTPSESSWSIRSEELGVFTGVFFEGLQGAADLNGDGVVTLSELYAYVSARIADRVKELHLESMQPTCTMPSNVPGNLPLAVVGVKAKPGIVPTPSQPTTTGPIIP